MAETMFFPDAEIIFRNFSGKPNNFGNTNKGFCLVLDDRTYEELKRDGFNVNEWQGRNAEEPTKFLRVNVRFDNIPPRIDIRKNDGTYASLDEEDACIIDTMDIKRCDVRINKSYVRTPGAKYPIAAYLNHIRIVPDNDPIDDLMAEDSDRPW